MSKLKAKRPGLALTRVDSEIEVSAQTLSALGPQGVLRGQNPTPTLQLGAGTFTRGHSPLGIQTQFTSLPPTTPGSATAMTSAVTATQIIEGVFLGGLHDALDPSLLKRHNIRRVICSMKPGECNTTVFEHDRGLHVLNIELADRSDEPINKFFDAAFEFIEAAVEAREGVLVHCHYGVSRSPTIVIAWLMRKMNIDFNQAFHYVKEKRNVIDPKFGFRMALEDYGTSLNNGFEPDSHGSNGSISPAPAPLSFD